MGIGTIGVVRPADVSIDDISIFYNYTPNRETNNSIIYPLVASEVLSYCNVPQEDIETYIPGTENLLEGLYDMRLPASIFNQLGIYTIYIKPKTIPALVVDCSVLSALPTVKGITLDINSLPDNLTANNALQGFRIEYINADGTKLRNVVRYVVSSNRVSPVSENIGNTTQRAVRYRFDDSGSVMFLQLTPSSSSDVKPNALPFIGNPGQKILLNNTYFSPLVIEVNMVKNTLDTIASILVGEQAKDVKNGISTYYDEERNITYQFNLFEIKDDVTNVPLYEVREKRLNVDLSQNLNDIINIG